jgi:DNA-binding NarL/FixJ family response regulator
MKDRISSVLLVDDHALFREGLALLLKSLVEDLRVTEAGSGEEALGWLSGERVIDLVLMDIHLPGMNGLEGIRRVREQWPDQLIVALSSQDDRETVLATIEAGAMGFIPKSASSSQLADALRVILARGIYLPQSAMQDKQRSAAHPASPDRARAADLGLTPRQTDVLWLILQGKPTKLICRELNLSASTVKVHTSAVLRALNVTSRTQAVVAAGRLGLRF